MTSHKSSPNVRPTAKQLNGPAPLPGEHMPADNPEPVGEEKPCFDDQGDAEQPSRGSSWLRFVPVAAMVLVAAWSAFFLATNRVVLANAYESDAVSNLIAIWTVPVILIAVMWLILMRSSTQEARRFGNIAASLEQQTALLEERLAIINRELGLARDFLGAEARELEFIGRSATDRINENAAVLQSLIQQNGAQIDAIANVSTTALDNMNALRQQLPVLAASARDMSNQVSNVGRASAEQISLLEANFGKMQEAGYANQHQIETLRVDTSDALSAIQGGVDDLVSQIDERLSNLQQRAEDVRRTMLAQEEEALASIKSRASRLGSELAEFHTLLSEQEDAHLTQVEGRLNATREQIIQLQGELNARVQEANEGGQNRLDNLRAYLTTLLSEIEQMEREADAGLTRRMTALYENLSQVDAVFEQRITRFNDGLAQRRDAWDEAEEASVDLLLERFDALDQKLSAYREQQVAQTIMLAEQSNTLSEQVTAAAAQVDEIVSGTETAKTLVTAAANTLIVSLGEARELIDESDAALGGVVAVGERLNGIVRDELLRSGEELQVLISDALIRFDQAEQKSKAVLDAFTGANEQVGRIEEALNSAANLGHSVSADIDELGTKTTTVGQKHNDTLQQMHNDFEIIGDKARSIAEEVWQSLEAVAQAVRSRSAPFDQDEAVSGELSVSEGAALVRAQPETIAELIVGKDGQKLTGEVTQRMREAAEVGHHAMVQLRDQLARVHELTSNLEARIARAREQSEENIDNDFSRRCALIIERLNSTAIDLDNLLSVEVSETAWASYLKGDRGVFTRKVIKLLNRREVREITDLYGADTDFRDLTNRYLHDFEAMLRSLLSTRNGNALGVLVLSSDMGRLYVALAQATERLRT